MRSLEEAVPYFGMITVQLAYGGANVLCKLALARGLSYLVFTVYRHLLAMAILGPLAYVLERKRRPALSLSILAKIFLLALFGTTIHQNVYYAGLSYTSPTVASAMSSVNPALTFILALMLKMEKVSIGSAKGRAKIIGAAVCISGALLFTFWKGHLLGGLVKQPLILVHTKGSGQGSQHRKFDDWIKGSLLILTSNIAFSAWLILQAMVYDVYPARLSMTALICFFASLQSSVLGLIFERKKSSWHMGWNIQMLTIVYCGTMISCLVYYLQTFCISKKGPVFAAMFSPLMLIIVGAFSAVFMAEKLYLGRIQDDFEKLTGLHLNRDKSQVYFNRDCPQKERWSDMLSIDMGQLPVKYLGLPLSINYVRNADCQGLIQYVQARLEGWQSQTLSFGGRIELIRSVIMAIAAYWLQAISIPIRTIQTIETLCANFIWHGGLHSIAWEELCRTREEGGLGLRSLRTLREVAMMKTAWRFIENDSLWARWTNSRYVQVNFWTQEMNNNHSVTFKSILRLRPRLKEKISRVIHNGRTTSLWMDPWCNHQSFIDRLGWPTYELVGSREPLEVLIQRGAWRTNARRIGQWYADEIASIPLVADNLADHWTWDGSITGKFSTKAVYEQERVQQPQVDWADIAWTKGAATKMKLCMYKAIRNRLLTRDRLAKFGVQIPSLMCPLCGRDRETRDHLFFQCPMSSCIWQHLNHCLPIPGMAGEGLQSILDGISTLKSQTNEQYRKGKIRLLSAVWHVWRERNRRIFEGTSSSMAGIIHTIEIDVRYMGGD